MKHVNTNAEFEKELEAMFGPAAEFRPTATYIRSADCIEVIVEPGAYRAERLDDQLTVYYRRSDRKITGFVIKGVRSLFEKWPGLRVEMHKGKVHSQHVIRAYVWSMPDNENEVYQKLIEAAEETDTEAELIGVG